MVDARAGVTTGDEIIAQALRRAGKPVILVANKCESRASDTGYAEAFGLGFGEPMAISAEHTMGFGALEEAIGQYVQAAEYVEEGDERDDGTFFDADRTAKTKSRWIVRSASPSSADPMSASRACSTGCSARSAR